MLDDLPNAYIFNVEMVLKWSKYFVPLLTIGKLRLDESMDHNLSLIELFKDYSMLEGRLYKRGEDGVLKLCIEAKVMFEYLRQAHIVIGNFHMSPKQTLR